MATITKTIDRVIPGTRDFIRITAELRSDDTGGLSDAFAITADLWNARKNASGKSRADRGFEQDACGCLHDEILKAAPELAPLVAVHLADPNGLPLHAVANGWYFYSGDARRYEENQGRGYGDNREGLTDHQRAARALNIPVADLPTDIASRDDFAAFAETLRSVWAEQARVARELLESL